MFEFVDSEENVGQEDGVMIIKVIGVGGVGGNIVEYMICEGVKGVEFICVNIDVQVLVKLSVLIKL